MLILWPLLQPPWHRACLGLSLLKTCVNLLRWRKRWSIFITTRWTLSCYSLRRISCPRRSPRLIRYEERLLSFGCPRTKNYTSALFQGHIYYAYTWGIRATFGGVTWRDLWKPHRRQILISQSLTQGYWWPNMQKEAQEYVKKCNQCQKFSLNIHQPRGVLNPLPSLWPFAQWALDIVESFLKVVGNRDGC